MENKKITTPLGKVLELKPYLTAKEYRSIRSVYVNAMQTNITGEGMQPTANFTGEVVNEAENRTIETTVVSYDGSTENIVDRVLSLPMDEFNFILEECNKSMKGNLTKTK